MSIVDHLVIVVYLALMVLLGIWFSRRQKSAEEYFLAGRNMAWWAVGTSITASLLSSLTYLGEPGEVWSSGATHMLGKMLGIPFEMLIVWLFLIPFMMRFRFTSAYEYLEYRFNTTARRLGLGLFLVMATVWMGFVVLASSRALAAVSGIPLPAIILTMGVVATIYTILGGLRAVIWTDVIQVILLIGGGLFSIAAVAWMTGSWLPQWYATTREYLLQHAGEHEALPWFSADPGVRATIVTVAINMGVWYMCTHAANQMTVQRYFSTSDLKQARRSFLTGSIVDVFVNLMLLVVGLALVHYYVGHGHPLPQGLNVQVRQQRDLIFPAFAIHELPPGVGGGILAALLAAAMSSIDSGINAIATVLCVELRDARRRRDGTLTADGQLPDQVKLARWITLAGGAFITLAALGLDYLPPGWGLIDAMPRTFNAIVAPLGSLFLIGIFLPRVGPRAAVLGVVLSLAASLGIGYFQPITTWLVDQQVLSQATLDSYGMWDARQGCPRSISFTWILPGSLLMGLLGAWVLSFLLWDRQEPVPAFSWSTRHDPSPLVEAEP